MGSPTLNQIFDAYIADRQNPNADRPCKHPDSLADILKQLRPLWGEMKLKDFGDGSRMRVREQVQQWRQQQPKPLSPHTIRKRVSVLKATFRFAIANELIKRKHEPIIDLPPGGAPRERCLSQEELARLLKAADDPRTPFHALLFLELALRTGQRKGAITPLTWDLVDFDERVIRFRDTETASQRSKKRRGNKPMDADLLEIMRYAYARRDCDYVISWHGKQAKCPYHSVKALFRRAGLPDLRLHDLRRSSATFVHIETDGDMKAAATHIVDTEATTRKHYVVDSPKVHMPGMLAVSGVMSRARGEKSEAA